jgi:hypothetical protein
VRLRVLLSLAFATGNITVQHGRSLSHVYIVPGSGLGSALVDHSLRWPVHPHVNFVVMLIVPVRHGLRVDD